MPIAVTMTSKMATHAPTSRARVILRSHLCPMYQKSVPTRQLRSKQKSLSTLHSKAFLQCTEKHHTRVCLWHLTDTLEVGLGGACRCRDGGSSQNGRRRSSCSLKFQAVTCSYNLVGTAATTHTRRPVCLLQEAPANHIKLKKQISKDSTIWIPLTNVCTLAAITRFAATEMLF